MHNLTDRVGVVSRYRRTTWQFSPVVSFYYIHHITNRLSLLSDVNRVTPLVHGDVTSHIILNGAHVLYACENAIVVRSPRNTHLVV